MASLFDLTEEKEALSHIGQCLDPGVLILGPLASVSPQFCTDLNVSSTASTRLQNRLWTVRRDGSLCRPTAVDLGWASANSVYTDGRPRLPRTRFRTSPWIPTDVR